ncbi:CapA family protein [Halomonas venusta]|uniref:CapA family protein n=1 Tax=Vreelandella venusta TaxID=44935 RepID=UPI00295E306E|nr:CapA family protein [Halomonas venusta]MDW0359736.1 CapA family protein [Halomonas venusta]
MKKTSIGFSGDILLHGALLSKARSQDTYNFDSMLKFANDIISADFNVVNQESLAAGEEFGISSYPFFNSPVSILEKLKDLNVGLVNVANNHMLDKGEEGLASYLENLDKIGLSYVGASLNGDAIKYVEVNGIKVAFVSYTDGSKINIDKIKNVKVNFFKGESYAMRMNRRLAGLKKNIKEAKKNSDFIVLSLHFGEEYFKTPSGFQKDIVSTLIETDIDVFIGHHPHVLQPIEWLENSKGKNVLVAYSLGNFFSGQTGLYRQVGCYLTVTLQKKGRRVIVDELRVTPTFVDVFNGYKLFKLKNFADSGVDLKTGKSSSFPSVDVYRKVKKHIISASLLESSLEVVYE